MKYKHPQNRVYPYILYHIMYTRYNLPIFTIFDQLHLSWQPQAELRERIKQVWMGLGHILEQNYRGFWPRV